MWQKAKSIGLKIIKPGLLTHILPDHVASDAWNPVSSHQAMYKQIKKRSELYDELKSNLGPVMQVPFVCHVMSEGLSRRDLDLLFQKQCSLANLFRKGMVMSLAFFPILMIWDLFEPIMNLWLITPLVMGLNFYRLYLLHLHRAKQIEVGALIPRKYIFNNRNRKFDGRPLEMGMTINRWWCELILKRPLQQYPLQPLYEKNNFENARRFYQSHFGGGDGSK